MFLCLKEISYKDLEKCLETLKDTIVAKIIGMKRLIDCVVSSMMTAKE